MKALLTMLLILAFVPAIGGAGVPNLLNYQGRLTDSLGYVVPDGNYSVTFRIYDDSLGSTALWTEGQLLTVKDGLFAVILGSVVSFNVTTFSDSVRWLGIQVGLDQEISPREKLVSVPFAKEAEHADISESSIYSDTANHAFSISDGIVTTDKLTENAVTSEKIEDGTIQFDDIGQNSADSGQVVKWDGANWMAGEDREYSFVSPGIAYKDSAVNGYGVAVYPPDPWWIGWPTVDSISISVPAEGYVQFKAWVNVGSAMGLRQCRLGYTLNNSADPSYSEYAEYDTGNSSDKLPNRFVIQFEKFLHTDSASTITAYFKATGYLGNFIVDKYKLTAIFYPVNYGE